MNTVLPSKTLSVSIECNPDKAYQYIREPENFPEWTTSFSLSVKKTDGDWIVETPDGPMKIRFVERNEWGVLDHYVTLASGRQLLNPMRVVPNGSGCEVLFTLYQQPDMSNEQFFKDAGMVEQDLRTLKYVLEGAGRQSR